MLVSTAITMVEALVYKPGWTFVPADHSSRFEDCILLTVLYPARDSRRSEAPAYAREIEARATFPIMVGQLNGDQFLYKIVQCLVEIETHEAREFLRINPTLWSPFNPHREDGIERWRSMPAMSDPLADLLFGVA